MPSEEDLSQLRQGSIIKAANVVNSANKDAAGPHWGVILDTTAEIRKNTSYSIAVISHDKHKIEKTHFMPVPGYTGRTGFIVASWIDVVHQLAITEIGRALLPPDILKLNLLIKAANAAKARAKKDRSKPA